MSYRPPLWFEATLWLALVASVVALAFLFRVVG